MRALVIASTMASATVALAQPAPEPAACFPACREGYTCRDGTCVAEDPRPSPAMPPSGVQWGPDSNAPGTGTQPLASDAAPAPPPPRTPPRVEIGLGFGLDAVFFSSKSIDIDSSEGDGLEDGFTTDHLNTSVTVDVKIREGTTASMFFAARIGFALVHGVQNDGSFLHTDSHPGVLVAAQQVFRLPLSQSSAPLLDRALSIDVAVGGFFASQGTLGGMANATLNVYWIGVGPQLAFGTETGFDVGLRLVSTVAF